ncbi:MAG TPA: adenylate/guanylate cyclase domain-containing protein [Ktedonobacteraceae bacterium]|nr:adenylate/guanylate cyclase domain-containing protein [Ktedonobacteraceae bacterium]
MPQPESKAATQPLPEILTPPEERRVVTVMFADITGSTPLAAHLDPEDMRAILTGYFNLMTEQIRKHGGTVEKYIGDAVMAVFGAPITHEDDPDRALRAALDMQAALTHFNEWRQAQDPEATRLQMRIGINTGEVAIPSNASHQRRDFLITGDAVNVAARLQQVATPETILVGERTYYSTREVFDFRAIAPLHLKGKPEPIPAYVVLGLRKRTPAIMQHPRGITGRQGPLIGRSLELTLMHASYARVQAEHRPHLITILGAPGIGKSRMVREFIAREQELARSAASANEIIMPRVLQGRCPPYGEGITYWPLIEILRSLLQVQDDESNETLQKRFTIFVKEALERAKRSESAEEIASTILRRIGRGLGNAPPTSDEQASREVLAREPQLNSLKAGAKQGGTQGTLLRAWRVLLEALATQQPLIIIVDDLQWADAALLDFLEYLTERITTVPILFLCPARPDFFERRRDWGGGKRNFTTIELEALSRDESSELVDALLNSDDLPEVLRNTILTKAEGNPFFVEEILRMFIDQGILVCEEDHEHEVECWRIGWQNEALLKDLNAPGEPEHLADTLLNMHYLLPLPVPDTIHGVLTARVDLLGPTEKLVLQHAAIIGRTFWLSALLELASDLEPESVLEALASLIRRDFVVETEKQARSPVEHDRVFTFKHILIRDVVHGNIPRTRRTQEHARLALWLEKKTAAHQELFIELLAYHYQQALTTWPNGLSLSVIEIHHAPDSTEPPIRLTRPELRRYAIHYLILAGDQALHSYYTVRAIQAYNDALEMLADHDAEPQILYSMHEKLGDAYSQRGSLDDAWQEYRAALRLASDEKAEVGDAQLLSLYERMALPATRWLSLFDNTPDAQEVLSYIEAGLQLSAAMPGSRERVAFLTYQAFWYTNQVETARPDQKQALVDKALTSGQEALRLAEEVNNPHTLSMTLDALGFIYCVYHKYNDVREMQQRRLKLESQIKDRSELCDLYISLGKAHEQVSDYPTALMWFGRAWNSAQMMESPSMLLASLTGRMHTWRQWNRWDNAIEVAQEILRLIEQYQQDEKRQFWALETLATIAYRRGEQEQGDQYARQCKRLIEQSGERVGSETGSLLGTRMHAIHLAHEDWTRATADYKTKLRSSEPFPAPEILAMLAELLVMTGEDPAIQAEMCERAISRAEEAGARKSLMIALRARGRMHMEQQNWKLAEDDLRQALQRSQVLDLPWERGNTLYQLGMLYKRLADSPDQNGQNRRNANLSRARYHFEQALGFFESLKAATSAQRVRLALIQDTTARV